MKLLWISEFPEDSGGIADCSNHIVRRLLSRGHDIDVLNNSGNGENVIGRTPTNPLKWRSILSDDYDAILVQYPGVSTLSLTAMSLFSRTNSSIMVMHEVPKGVRFLPMLSGFRNFAFLSEKAKEDFLENFHFLGKSRKSELFNLPYHGVEENLPEKISNLDYETEINSSKRSIICPGFIVERKQYHKVVEAFPKLLKEFPESELIIAGGPHKSEGSDYLDRIEDLVEQKGLEDRVTITGNLEDEEHLYRYVLEGDVCVLPYQEIYQSGILARCLALGTKTIVSPIKGLKNPVGEYGGLVLESVENEEIAGKISEALEQDINVDSERFREEMSWESRADRYEEILNEVAE